jgi:hypothetical protein
MMAAGRRLRATAPYEPQTFAEVDRQFTSDSLDRARERFFVARQVRVESFQRSSQRSSFMSPGATAEDTALKLA